MFRCAFAPLNRHLLAEDKEDIPHLIAGVRRHVLDLIWTCELDYTHIASESCNDFANGHDYDPGFHIEYSAFSP